MTLTSPKAAALLLPIALLLLTAPPALAAEDNADNDTNADADAAWLADDQGVLTLRRGLLLPEFTTFGREAIHRDPLAAAIADRSFTVPRAGDAVETADGRIATWRPHEAADADAGRFHLESDSGARSYLSATLELDEPAVMLLDAAGHSVVYVNDAPLAGDPYHHGNLLLPVELEAGENHLLFHVARDRLTVSLRPLRAPLPSGDPDDPFPEPRGPEPHMFAGRDHTLFDPLTTEPIDGHIGVTVLNPTDEWQEGFSVQIVVHQDDFAEPIVDLPPIAPMAARKVPVHLEGPPPQQAGPLGVTLNLLDRGGNLIHWIWLTLDVRQPHQPHRRTFISEIDGSVQHYAVLPARTAAAPAAPPTAAGDNPTDLLELDDPAELLDPFPPVGSPPSPGERPGLVLALHGAGIEPLDFLAAYTPKPDLHIVAPANRRSFGFDFEDWGRLDALEVLDRAAADLQTHPRRVYLTGHSMGGHGAYHLAVNHPDRFAAVAPSAGWLSYFTYEAARRPDAAGNLVAALMRRALHPSDTRALARNLAPLGVYILHGEADARVPTAESRTLLADLAAFHTDFAYFEKPDAGHWWDDPFTPGVGAVDWPPIFHTFARRTLPEPESVDGVRFATAHPGVSARYRWAVVHTQRSPFLISRVDLHHDRDAGAVIGQTANVAVLQLDAARFTSPLDVNLDGQPLTIDFDDDASRLTLALDDYGNWQPADPPPAEHKHPGRAGPFRAAFDDRMIFVYATQGSDEENAWAFNKARLDAQTFLYRGNGDARLLPDVDYDPADHPDRSVVLYGHAESNAAWASLLEDAPLQVEPGRVTLGPETYEGTDLAALLVRPHPHSETAHVAAVTGTSPHGMRLTDRLPLFVSGVAYPDYFIFRADALYRGLEAVEAAGFFESDWSLKPRNIITP